MPQLFLPLNWKGYYMNYQACIWR